MLRTLFTWFIGPSWFWKLKVTHTAVIMVMMETRQNGQVNHETEITHDFEENFKFMSKRGLEAYLKKHPSIEVTECHEDQRWVTARDKERRLLALDRKYLQTHRQSESFKER